MNVKNKKNESGENKTVPENNPPREAQNTNDSPSAASAADSSEAAAVAEAAAVGSIVGNGAEAAVQDSPEETSGEEEYMIDPEALSAFILKAEEEIKNLRSLLDETRDHLLRTAAEYDNYRKRTLREKEAIWSDSVICVVKAILPVLDNLERAEEADRSDGEAYAKGISMVLGQFREAISKLGAEPVGVVGDTFDPNFESAVSHIESGEHGENVISLVMQKGYRIGNKIIRPAMVQVAN